MDFSVENCAIFVKTAPNDAEKMLHCHQVLHHCTVLSGKWCALETNLQQVVAGDKKTNCTRLFCSNSTGPLHPEQAENAVKPQPNKQHNTTFML